MDKITHEEFSVLLSRFKPIITSIVSRYRGRCKKYGVDPEDLEQAAAFKLWKISRRKDPNDDYFERYVRKAIHIGIYNTILRHATSMNTRTMFRHGMKDYPDTYVSLDALVEAANGDDGVCGSDTDDDTVLTVREFLDTLPPQYAEIIQDRMAGYTLTDIAIRHRLTRKELSCIMTKIKTQYLRLKVSEEECMRCDAA